MSAQPDPISGQSTRRLAPRVRRHLSNFFRRYARRLRRRVPTVPPFRRKPLFEAMESRILLSADGFLADLDVHSNDD